MNFPGKIGSTVSDSHPISFVDVETIKHHTLDGGYGSITIADAQLLYNGDYKRSGVDLILSKDGHQLVVPDYFKGEHRASLASPDGSHLTGDIVNALAGNVEYAQASGVIDANRVIGHVTKLTGTATAIRNGVSIILNNGDNVEKGDVLQAGSDSQVGVTFIDGTVFGLSSNARMVLNEMVYDPNGSSNSSLLTLVAGTISFVAGETAKHGDMKVDTPTATLGIRGTAVLVEIDFTVPASGNTPAVNFQVLAEPDGHTGSYTLYSKPTAANPIPVVIGTVDQSGQSYTITANNQLASTAAPALSPQAAAIVLETFVAKFNAPPPAPAQQAPAQQAPTNANPQSAPSGGGGGSSTPPPPATPLDTSPIDNHNTQPTDQTPTPTPISTTPTAPTNTTPPPTTTTTTTQAAGGAIPTTITVTPAVDTPNAPIPTHVVPGPNPPPTFVAFVPGSGQMLSATSTQPVPAGVDITKLVTIDETTGTVSYDPASFAFLKTGQSVTVKIGFQSFDGVENVSETFTDTINGTSTGPTVAISNPTTITNSATQTISGTAGGTAAPGDTVTITDTVNGVARTIGTTIVQSDGSWTATVTLSGDGTHSISASETDPSSNSATSAPVAITLDTIPPAVTITTTDHVSNVATQTISGTVTASEAPIGATVTLFDTINGVTSQIGTATVDNNGHWTTQVTLVGDGSHAIVAVDLDAVGNIGSSPPVAITLDTVPPAVTINTQGATTNQATQTISGTVTTTEATAGETVTLFDTVNGVKTQIGTATLNGDNWSTSVVLSGDGVHNIVAEDTDAAGNTASSAPVVFTLATVAPTIAINSPIAGDNIINMVEAGAGVTLSGTVAAGTASIVNGQTATITIVDSSNVVKDTLQTTVSGGNWSVNLTAAQAEGLADGTYTVKADVTDAAGNAATTATQAITIDEIAPTIAIGTVAGDNIINKTEAAAGVTVSGTVTAGTASIVNGQTATITIVDSSNIVKDTLLATVSGGAWSVNLTAAQAQGLADGTYTVKANVFDTAGNAATVATEVISVETLAPTVTINTPGTTTNQATQTISGTVTTTEAAAGGTVTLFDTVNGVTTQIGTATLNGGTWSTSVTLAGNGANSIVAKDTDDAGNTGSSGATVFTLATAAPTITITSPVAGDNVVNKTEAAAGITISGTAAAGIGGAVVDGQIATITIVDSSNAIKDMLTTAVSGGTWSVNLTAAQAQGLADGTYTVKANVSDAAGNTATTATQAITVDETAPTITITSPVAGDNIINKTEAGAGVTISGTVAAGSTSTVNGQTATITIVDSTNTVKDTLTATVSGGNWSVNLTAAQAQGLADGTYTIKANVSDTAGNAATTATQAITVDETAPTIAITRPIAGDNIINKTEAAAGVTISGTVAAGSTSTVNGQTATITIVDSSNTVKDTLTATVSGGNWSVNLTAAQAQGLADGTYTVKANVSDAAGNTATTATQAITVDETAPTIAITNPIAGDNIINKAEAAAGITVSGTVSAGTASTVNGQTATITILDSSNNMKDTLTTTVSGGTWSVNLTAAQAQGLADGTYTVKANVSDAAGNAAATATQTIAIDTLAPTVIINTAGITTNQAAQTISGTVTTTEAAAGGTVTLFDTVNGVTTQIGTATVSGGTWSTTATLSGNGANSIVAQDTDVAGNVGNSSPTIFTLATVAPTITIATPIAGDNTINKTEAAAGVTMTGTATAGTGGAAVNGQTATITIVDSTNTVKDTLTATVSGGNWSVNLTAAQAQGLADGTYTVKANVSDAAGNAATTATQAITVDETAPTITITSPIAGDNIINKAEATAGVTISGTVSAGTASTVNGQTATITIVDSSNNVKDTLTATVSGGNWSVNLTAAEAQGLADGTYTVKANVSDAAGNAATTATQAITIDETAPTIAITSPIAGDNTINKTEAAAGITISGTAAAGIGGAVVDGQIATITIVDSSNAIKDMLTTAVSGGTWSVNLTAAQAQGLADGTYTVKANVSDAAGNTATTATQAITVDETAPTGGTPDLATAADSGTSNTDNITNVTAPSFTVALGATVAVGDTVQLLLGGSALAHPVTHTITAADVTAQSVTLAVTAGDLGADGTKSISAQFSDAAGNTSTTAALNITLDTTAPTGGTPDLVAASDSGTSSTDNITDVTAPSFTVALNPTVAVGDTVQLLLGGSALAHPVTHTITAADVTAQSVTLAVTAGDLGADGTKSITAQFSDAAGNTSTTSVLSITLDTTAPTGGTPDLVAASDSGTSSTDNITNVTAPSFTVALGATVAVGDTVQLLLGGSALAHPVIHTITAADVTAQSVTLAVTPGDLGADGTKSITAQFSDAAGNTSTTSALSVTLDTTAPTGGTPDLVAASDSGTSSTDNITDVTAPSFTVALNPTVAVGDTVQLLLGGSALAHPVTHTITAADVTAQSVTLAVTAGDLGADGTKSITAQFSDAAGNTSTTSALSITLDTTAPHVTINGAGGPTTLSTQTISGTVTTTEAAAGGTVLLFDTYNGVQTQIGTATLSGSAWSTTVTLSGSGTHSIVAEDTDTAGNTGISPTVVYSLTVAANSWANPNGGSWTVGANWSSGTVPSSTADVMIGPSIGATAPYSITIASGTTVLANSLQFSDFFATLVDQGTLSIASTLSLSAGTIEIEDAGTLSLGGGSAFTVNFAGTGGNLVLGNAASFVGPIVALSTADGAVNITGSANLSTIFGDAIDLTASGGTQANPSNLTLGLTGTISGLVTGIDVIQNAVGNITVTTSGSSVTGQTQRGIFAEESATGVGSVLVTGSANVTGGGSAFSGIVAENLDTANTNTVTVSQTGNVTGGTDGIKALTDGTGNVSVTTGTGATITGTNDYGIEAFSNSTGSVSVTTATNDTIVSGSAGINVYNQATSIPQTGGATTSTITVTSAGTIDSGFLLTGSSSKPAGILAGYKGGASTTANPNVFGNVLVNNSANINATAGDGIRAYNYGSGNVTVNDLANSTIIAEQGYGIQAFSDGKGNLSVSTDATDIIDAGASGINAVNEASSIAVSANSTVSVTARGTINTGTQLNNSGSQPQGISAGYFSNNGTSDTNVNGTVSVDNFATINAAAGWGIDAYNYGNGSVTVTDEANTTVSGTQFGIGAYSNSSGANASGSVTVNVGNNATISSSSLYGEAGIQANENNAGNISITTTTGDVINSGGIGIQANNQATSVPSNGRISLTTAGTINSGYGINVGGGQPGGITGGYNAGGSGTVNTNVAGNVIVDNSATINAPAGVGIGLNNWGTGTISLTLESSSQIFAELWGVNADTQGGGDLTIVNKGSITDAHGVGISANIGTGAANSVSGVVSVNNSGAITALGSSASPVVQINNSSTQAAIVTNSGTITANLLGKSSNNQAIGVYNGTVTINNNGTISGNVSLNGGTFNNNANGTWNLDGNNYFGNGAGAIINAGIISIAGLSFLGAGGSLSFANTNTVNIAANADANINAAVTGSGGLFTIGDRAELEFSGTGTVAAGQTVAFTDGNGLLALDNPASFSGSIAGLSIGDQIELGWIGATSASVSGSTLTVQTGNNGPLTFQISGNLANASFDVLSGDEIVLLPTASIQITGSLTQTQSFAPTTAAYYALTSAAINVTGITGLNVNSTDSTAGNYLFVTVDQNSTVMTSGAATAINLTSTFDNIELINWGAVNSPGGTGIFASSTSGGSIDIFDNANVSAAQPAISAHTDGTGTLNVTVGNGSTVSSSNNFGIFALATGSGNIAVSTIQGATVTGGTTAIFAENQGTTVGSSGSPSNILVTTSGTINSGATPSGGEAAGIQAGFLGGTTAPSSPPNAAVFGNVTVNNNANITASTGFGINTFDYGTGNITIDDGPNTTITATAAGTTTTSTAQYGIDAFNYGSGNTTVTTEFGSIINSGAAGIIAIDQYNPTVPSAGSNITIVNNGTINSGANNGNGGAGAPAGIYAGFNPSGSSVFNPNLNASVLIEDSGTINAAAGDGINAFDYGVGTIEVDLAFGAAITALTSASSGNTAPYGISAVNRGTGDVIVNMSNNDNIHSGGAGVNANNQDASILASANAIIAVYAAGTITSGTILNNNGSQASGVQAGFLGGASQGANTNVNGTVVVDNTATIVASAGSAINAFNYGNGNVTVNDAAGTTISGGQYGISAYTESGGTGNLSINVGANANITATDAVAPTTGTNDYGIQAFSTDAGNISIITSSGDTVNANGTGINAVNEATTIAQSVGSSIVVTVSAGTINSGTEETGSGSPPGGIVAGYLPANVIPTTYPLTTLYGDVEVNNSANINAAAGDGIRAYDYGIGDVEVNDFAGSIILQGEVAIGNSGLQNGYGAGINASNGGSGDIYVMTAAGTSIDASLAGSGISAINKAPAPTGNNFTIPDTSYVEVLAYGTIKSGTDLTGSGDIAAGILAGYNPANADIADSNVHGTVHIDDYASITAGGDGIRGVNYGDGTITIIAEAGAVITAQEYGIAAIGGDGGDISITTSAILTGSSAAIETTTSAPAETVTIENLGHMTGLVLTENAAFDNGAGAEWDVAGASIFASGTNTLTNEGVIDSTGTASITATTGTLSVTNTGTVNVESGSLDIGAPVTGTGQLTIANGATLEFGGSVSSGQTITFDGSTGTLKLDDPTDFHGVISGLTGSDGIDLAGFDSTTVITPDIGTSETILTVTDDNHTGPLNEAVITLLGNYNGSTFNFSNVQGGVLIVDPPAAAPAMTTITATAANQTLTGTGTPDNFVFNFANVGQATVTNFHADTDILEVKGSLFANLQAVMDATHDDANGNAIVTLDAHDSITLTGVSKAQLNPADFHLV